MVARPVDRLESGPGRMKAASLAGGAGRWTERWLDEYISPHQLVSLNAEAAGSTIVHWQLAATTTSPTVIGRTRQAWIVGKG